MQTIDKEWLLAYLKGMFVILKENKLKILKLQPNFNNHEKRVIRDGILAFIKAMIDDVEDDFINFVELTKRLFDLENDSEIEKP